MRVNGLRYLGTPADVKRGTQVGAVLGVLFALRTSLGAVMALNRHGYSNGNPGLISVTVFLGACAAGALFGALRPLTRRLPLAMVLGSVLVFPVVLTLDVIRNRVTFPPGSIDWTVDVATALIIGPIGALAARTARPSERPA